MESSRSASMSLAEAPKSLPEIVQAFREYVALVTSRYARVLIGIDELDKVGSDRSQQFVNEIKAVFGLDKCFYILSVS